MKKKHLLIGLILIALSSWYAFRNVSLDDLRGAFASVRYRYLFHSIILVALTFLFRALRWRCLVSSVKAVPVGRLFSPLMIGFMGNFLPARAGEFIRAYLLGKREQISFSASFATIFVERLMDMLLFLALLVGVLFFSAETFAQSGGGGNHRLMGYMIKFGWISFIGSLGIFLFSVLLQYKNNWAIAIVDVMTKPLPPPWREKIFGMVHSFTDGLKILKDARGFAASLALSVLVWIAMILFYYPLIFAFGLETQLPVTTAVLVTGLTIGIFISLFPTPGFLGAFQAACVVALHEIFGVSKAIAASYGIIAWLIAMGFIIVAGTFFVIKDNVSLAEIASGGVQK
ncbi:MAG: flippase-like domain-containing protein [Nitrospiraceae bacterium]|nr:MAG: flippase-like domain-containing protein [Nitrospiraceae bacterium]